MEWNGISCGCENHRGPWKGLGYHKGNIYIRNLQKCCRNIAETECWMDWDLKGKLPIEIEIIYGRVMIEGR